MKKSCLIFIAILFITGTCVAQVPGYIGRRFHIQAGIHMFPQFSRIPVNVAQPDKYYIISGLNYRATFSMDFVITRKSSVGLTGHYFNTASSRNIPIDIDYDTRFGIEGGSIGAVFKTHFGPWIAPLGPYFKAEAGAILYTVSDPLNKYNGNLSTNIYPNGYIAAGLGRTHIFANRISLDYGGELAMVFPPYDDYYVSDAANVRMAVHYAATVYVKIGVVL